MVKDLASANLANISITKTIFFYFFTKSGKFATFYRFFTKCTIQKSILLFTI